MVEKISQAAKERMAVRKVLPRAEQTQVKEEPGETREKLKRQIKHAKINMLVTT